MLQSFLNGLGGMLGFSKGIDVLSQNIANMNTPAYKAKVAVFHDITGNNGDGLGVSFEGTNIQDKNGNFQDRENDTTLAIDGAGYFILRDPNGEIFYTRAGDFRFDDEFKLVDASGRYNVMAVDTSNNLSEFSISDIRLLEPKATSSVVLSGNLTSTPPGQNGSPLSHLIQDILVYDVAGDTHEIKLEFTRQDAIDWNVEIKDENDNVLATKTIGFNADGSPVRTAREFAHTFSFKDQDQTITFSIGSDSKIARSSSAPSDLSASVEDGNTISGFTTLDFDSEGIVTVSYTNGDEEKGQQLAVANINDISQLTLVGGSLYRASSGVQIDIGRAEEGANGKILGKKLELSNTELTEQFAQLLIAQQGYTASSRVMNVANQLIESLYGNSGGR